MMSGVVLSERTSVNKFPANCIELITERVQRACNSLLNKRPEQADGP
jgi:hypothetical protein